MININDWDRTDEDSIEKFAEEVAEEVKELIMSLFPRDFSLPVDDEDIVD